MKHLSSSTSAREEDERYVPGVHGPSTLAAYEITDRPAARALVDIDVARKIRPWSKAAGRGSALTDFGVTLVSSQEIITMSLADVMVTPGQDGVELRSFAVDLFPPPSEETFESLAENDPESLLAWIRSGQLNGPQLSFAAEIAGCINLPGTARTLLPLLQNPSAPIREGAIYGLRAHLDESGVVSSLRRIASTDKSAAIRRIATAALDDLA